MQTPPYSVWLHFYQKGHVKFKFLQRDWEIFWKALNSDSWHRRITEVNASHLTVRCTEHDYSASDLSLGATRFARRCIMARRSLILSLCFVFPPQPRRRLHQVSNADVWRTASSLAVSALWFNRSCILHVLPHYLYMVAAAALRQPRISKVKHVHASIWYITKGVSNAQLNWISWKRAASKHVSIQRALSG